jgi:hypothetical protein
VIQNKTPKARVPMLSPIASSFSSPVRIVSGILGSRKAYVYARSGRFSVYASRSIKSGRDAAIAFESLFELVARGVTQIITDGLDRKSRFCEKSSGAIDSDTGTKLAIAETCFLPNDRAKTASAPEDKPRSFKLTKPSFVLVQRNAENLDHVRHLVHRRSPSSERKE